MTLFTQLSPQSQKLIEEYTDLINDHLEEWIQNELGSADKIFAERVIMYFTLAKRRKNGRLGTLKCTPYRRGLIKKISKLGHKFEQFQAVIDFMILKFWDTKYRDSMITPEYVFRPANFEKYLDAARDHYIETNQKKVSTVKNQYEELVNK